MVANSWAEGPSSGTRSFRTSRLRDRGASFRRSVAAVRQLISDALAWTAFRIHGRWLRLEIAHEERARRIPLPSLLVFNYAAPYAPLVVLRAIPRRVRRHVVVAADADAWTPRRRWQGWLVEIAVRGFPFSKSGSRGIRSSIAAARAHLAAGRVVLISPEGTPSMSEEPGPFLTGIGLLATRARVPVVPFRLVGYSSLYAARDPGFPWLPSRRGATRLVVGAPFQLPYGLGRVEAAQLVRRAVLDLA